MTADQKERARAIGERIVSARKRKGMSQVKLAEALAERAGVAPETARRSLVNNETGKFAPRVKTLQAIAEITEQPLEFFVSPEADTSPTPFLDAA